RGERGEQDRLEANGSGLQEHVDQRPVGRARMADEVDEQYGIAHDDAGERDEADHRSRRERRMEQPMADHDADQGERDRRQNDEWQLEGFELRDDQNVDAEDGDAESRTY